jgi:hypothetical protein
MLKEIEDINEFKKQFSKKLRMTLNENKEFREFLYEIFVYGTAYIIGGYIRDLTLNKESRDLDIMLTTPYEEIMNIIKSSNLNYTTNRLNGIKIKLNNLEADIWSIENNWAFKNKLVIQNDDYILDSIANGCFYNYDSLVINVHTNKISFRNFNNFVKSNTLDIIQKNKNYKILNPTVEANILRAFYLRKIYSIKYTNNCNNYLLSRIGFLKDNYGSSFNRLMEFKKKYIKYDLVLTKEDLIENIDYCYHLSSQNLLRI